MKNRKLMEKIVDRLKHEPGLILLHHNADIDAMGSALALQAAFSDFRIGAFQNISQISKKILNRLGPQTILTKPKLQDFKTIVILDTSTPSQLGVKLDHIQDYIVMDHHLDSKEWNTELYYCDASKTSCAEIILELLQFINFNITPKVAKTLLVAILADTGHFKFATLETFLNFSKLLEISDLRPAEVFEILENTDKIDKSQRIAHLKGAQRLKFEQLHGYIVASSIISSYEASMCKQLIVLGADIAFVGAQRDEQVRISARAGREVVERGLHLGEFFQGLGSELSCEGGGHDGAAGLNGTGDVEMVLNACIGKISHFLKKL